MLKITKKGDKYWLFEDSEIGLFSPSKFTINLELNEIVIVYENGLKSKNYNVIDCEIYDLGATSPFTTSSGDLFMQKLEELNCPCFQKNENIYNISGGAWGDITGNLSNQTDLQTVLDLKLNKDTTAGVERAYIINADGSQGTKATSELGGKRTWILAFSGGVYYDTTSVTNWSGMAVNGTNSLGLNGHTSGLLFIANAGTTGLPLSLSSARVIPYNCKIKSFHIRNASSPYSALNPANFKLRFYTHTPNGTATLNNPILQGEFNSTGFNMPVNYVYPSSCFTNNNFTLQAGDVITVIHKKEQTLTSGTAVHDFYLEFEEI